MEAMILIGISYLLTWLLVEVFNLDIVKALLITAIVFIIGGLVMGERSLKG